jgi:transposase InsO family protein
LRSLRASHTRPVAYKALLYKIRPLISIHLSKKTRSSLKPTIRYASRQKTTSNLDLFSRRIVGWSLREQMTSELVIDALRMAWFLRCPHRSTNLLERFS